MRNDGLQELSKVVWERGQSYPPDLACSGTILLFLGFRKLDVLKGSFIFEFLYCRMVGMIPHAVF
jgi:tricorn protease-like protein